MDGFKRYWGGKNSRTFDFLNVKSEEEGRERTPKCLGWTTGF